MVAGAQGSWSRKRRKGGAHARLSSLISLSTDAQSMEWCYLLLSESLPFSKPNLEPPSPITDTPRDFSSR